MAALHTHDRTVWIRLVACLIACLPASAANAGPATAGELRITGRVDITRPIDLAGDLAVAPGGSVLVMGGITHIAGQTLNDGRIELLDASITFAGGLVNGATLLFDPSTITVTDLTVGPNGYMAETGDPGDRFIITGYFINQSTRNTDWQTDNTIFQFNGGSGHDAGNPQTLEAAGADLGNYSAAWQDNFVLGTLEIGPSDTHVLLVDDYGNSAACLNGLCEAGSTEAVYVNNLVLESGATLDLAGMNLYVRNSFTDNGGSLVNGSVTVGDVPTLAGDINGNGTLDGADLLLAHRHLLGLAVLTLPQLARGDVYPAGGDGLFTLADLVVLSGLIL
jgi:hypothetical protein